MPLCFFMNANDPRFLSTLKHIMKSRERDGLTECVPVLATYGVSLTQLFSSRNNLVYRYDTNKVDDGTGGGGEPFMVLRRRRRARTSDSLRFSSRRRGSVLNGDAMVD
jgi:GH15 family glucan-1,4-alpha-glucosidase